MPYSFSKYERDFNDWCINDYPNVSEKTYDFIHKKIIQSKLWPHQKQAILRTIYSYEILKGDLGNKYLLNIVTGGGKSLIIAYIIAWLKYVNNDIDKFVIILPNLIVKDRISSDFVGNNGRTIFTDWDITSGLNISLRSVELNTEVDPPIMYDYDIVITNIQELYPSHPSTGRKLIHLLNNYHKIVVITDEAHNNVAEKFSDVLESLYPKTLIRIDTTATPTRADGTYPDSKMIYKYDLDDALHEANPIVKNVIIVQPEAEIKELTYTNIETNEVKKITELDKEFEDAENHIKPFQWIMDAAPMKHLISIAWDRIKQKRIEANGRYKPVLFVVTMSVKEAERVRDIMEEMGIKTLCLTEDSPDEYRKEARNIGSLDSEYDAVVSVFMLKEGWDVKEVSVILLLRKIISPVYGQQIIGRGLRKIDFTKANEVLYVIDHPSMKHLKSWLGNISADVYTDVKLGEQLPYKNRAFKSNIWSFENERRIVRPEKIIVIDEPKVNLREKFELYKKAHSIQKSNVYLNWKDLLNAIEYNDDTIEITAVKEKSIKEITIINQDSPEIKYSDSDKIYSSYYDTPVSPKSILEYIYDVSKLLLDDNGLSIIHTDLIYDAMLSHVQSKLCHGKSIYDVDSTTLNRIYKLLKTSIVPNFTFPILKGIIETSGARN
jgi:type III restriction enzyme